MSVLKIGGWLPIFSGIQLWLDQPKTLKPVYFIEVHYTNPTDILNN